MSCDWSSQVRGRRTPSPAWRSHDPCTNEGRRRGPCRPARPTLGRRRSDRGRFDDQPRRCRAGTHLTARADQFGEQADGAMTRSAGRIEMDPEDVGRDLGRLVLTIVELVRQLMERQALRRVDVGDLSDETVERLGVGLMRLEEAMEELREYFGLRPEDLNLDLGPLGPLLPREPG